MKHPFKTPPRAPGKENCITDTQMDALGFYRAIVGNLVLDMSSKNFHYQIAADPHGNSIDEDDEYRRLYND